MRARFSLLLAVFLSGAAGLVYQLVWMRSLSLVLGSAHTAIAAVLAAYMGGLALGGLLGARHAAQLKNPLRAFATLEGLVAASALAFPGFLALIASGVPRWLGAGTELPAEPGWAQSLVYSALATTAIAVPTICMGATLPVLVHATNVQGQRPGEALPELYGTNTLGAAAGAALGGFVLLPALGVAQATRLAAGLNVLAILLVMFGKPAGATAAAALAPDAGTSPRRLPVGTMPAMGAAFAVSVASFALEVFWSRLLAHLLGGTVQGFALMLAVTLLGIGIGGLLARHAGRIRGRTLRLLAATLVAAGLATLGAYVLLAMAARTELLALSRPLIILLALLPASVAIGATFPLFVQCVCRQPGDYPLAAGHLYAASTVGAIAGSLASANLLLPALHFEGLVALAAAAFLLTALAVIWRDTGLRGRWAGVAGATAVVTASLVALPVPHRILASSAVDTAEPTEERFFAVGRNATIQVQERPFGLLLRGDGLPEALISRRGAVPGLDDQAWLGALGAMSRPAARDMLMIGLGGGVSLEAVPAGISRIDVVEIEPQVIAANAAVAGERRHDPLRDPRVRIVVNDARNALLRSSASYDVIVSQPSHPWTAASANLYSREFLALVRRRLAPDGVFVQWMNAAFLDASLLRRLAATIAGEFSHVRVYEPVPMSLVFLASARPLDPGDWFAARAPDSAIDPDLWRNAGIVVPEDLRWSLLLDDAGVRQLAAGVMPVSDDRNVLALDSRPGGGMTEEEFTRLIAPLDQAARLQDEGLRGGYLAYRLGLARAGRLALATGLHDVPSAEGTDMAGNSFTGPEDRDNDPVMRGRAAARQGDWAMVQSLDEALAAVPRLAPGFAAASRLRAEWRLVAAAKTDRRSEVRRIRLAEAVTIIDAAAVSSVTTDLLFQRAAAAEMAGDRDVLVETTAALAEMVHQSPSLRGVAGTRIVAELRLQRRRLEALSALLTALPPDARGRQVQDLLQASITRLRDIEAMNRPAD